MYFENTDECELTVRYHLTLVRAKEWAWVLDELDALCMEATTPEGAKDWRRRLEDQLIQAIAEVVWENSEEEPTGSEYRPYGRQDPDSWQWAREDAMLDAMGGVA